MIFKVWEDILVEWLILPSKVIAVVTDNGSKNMLAALIDLEEEGGVTVEPLTLDEAKDCLDHEQDHKVNY